MIGTKLYYICFNTRILPFACCSARSSSSPPPINSLTGIKCR